MTNGFIALMAAVGFGGWAYAKANRRTGGNTQSAIIVALIAGSIAALIVFTLLASLDDFLKR